MSNFYNPLVTIIVPCYNHGAYLGQALESLMQQTYQNLEIIVINNGSNDNSGAIISNYSKNAKFLIINLEKNIPPGAENQPVSLALKQARGDFISILYSDDYYMPNKIEAQIKAFESAPSSVGIVHCHGYYLKHNNLETFIMSYGEGYLFKKYLIEGDQVIPISPLVKKECYQFVGINHPWTGSEYDYFVMSQYFDFTLVNEHLVVMRQHDRNEGLNVLKTFNRYVSFNNILFASESTKKRSEGLQRIRNSKHYMIYARDLAALGDRSNFFRAFKLAILTRPSILISKNAMVCILFSFFPSTIFNYMIRKLRSFKRFARF